MYKNRLIQHFLKKMLKEFCAKVLPAAGRQCRLVQTTAEIFSPGILLSKKKPYLQLTVVSKARIVIIAIIKSVNLKCDSLGHWVA